MRMPLLRPLAEWGYPVLARNRHRIPRGLVRLLFEGAVRRAAERSALRAATPEPAHAEPSVSLANLRAKRKETIMSANLFFVSLLIALVGPVIAISYLKPILYKVLRMLCDADGGAEFWIRCAYLLAVSGTLLLMLSFGEFNERSSVIDTVRRSLWLVLAGVFCHRGDHFAQRVDAGAAMGGRAG
jgi:hypothetical protein